MFINTLVRVFSAVKMVLDLAAVTKQCEADLSELVQDTTTFAHVTNYPVVVSDVYCAGFASAFRGYIILSQGMYAMYLRGEERDYIEAFVKHEEGHHVLGHTSVSDFKACLTATSQHEYTQREYEADEYSYMHGYDMAGALAHVKPAAVYMHGPDVGDLIDDRIDRLHTLDILPF